MQPTTPNIYFSDFKTIGVKTLDNDYTFDGTFVPQVDVYTEIGNNPAFEHKDCITETKIKKRPMLWRSVNMNNWTTHGIWGQEYNKSEVSFFYNHALSFFNTIRPSGHVFIRSKMAYDRPTSSWHFGNFDSEVLPTDPYKYDCISFGNCQLVNVGVQAFYGIYAKINYRNGPIVAPGSYSGGEPDVNNYN